jgi:hypothetical protein
MASRWVVASIAALAVLSSVGASASPVPELTSATARHGHVVVTFTLGAPDLAPGRIVVAVEPERSADGAFSTANIRLDEALRASRVHDGYRARTRRALTPGRYWVEISGVVTGVDCLPLKPCRQTWSNVRRVALRRSG